MNVPFDPKKLSNDQVESNNRMASNLIFDAQVALGELSGVLICLFTSLEESEEEFSDDKIKAVTTICESLAEDISSKIKQALPFCSIHFDKQYQKAFGLLTAIEELKELRVSREYTILLISALLSFSKKLNSELNKIQSTI